MYAYPSAATASGFQHGGSRVWQGRQEIVVELNAETIGFIFRDEISGYSPIVLRFEAIVHEMPGSLGTKAVCQQPVKRAMNRRRVT